MCVCISPDACRTQIFGADTYLIVCTQFWNNSYLQNMSVYIYINVCMYNYIYVCMHDCMNLFIYIYIYACIILRLTCYNKNINIRL